MPREPRALLCFPDWGDGKFHSHEQDYLMAQEALCLLNVRLPVNPPLFDSEFIKEPLPYDLAGWLDLPTGRG